MPRRPHVALIVETSVTYGRRILSGISRYLHSHEQWSLFLQQSELHMPPPRWLANWRGDGIICRPTSPRLAKAFRTSGVPVVDLNDTRALGLPRIRSDDAAIGRLGAEHLLERGFRHFAFGGFTDETWAALRRDGYAQALKEAGHDCALYESYWRGPRAPTWDDDQKAIARWIKSLPKPLGVMTCNDVRGQHVLDACRRINVAVPEAVAVIGVDNEDPLCDLCDPPLSTVVPDAQRIGYEAAEMLDALMSAKAAAGRCNRLIAPLGVVTRQSTDLLAIPDADVAAAVRYIREFACRGTAVADVLRHVPISRSLLERRFRQYLGRSPQAEIRSVQLKRVRQLLAETDLPLKRIAQLTGFEHPEYLSVVFKRQTGQTPGQYRSGNTPAADAPRQSDGG